MSVPIIGLFIILLFAGLILTGLTLLIVAAVKRKNAAGLWIAAGVVAILILVLPLGLVFLSYQRVATHQSTVAVQKQAEALQHREALRLAQPPAAVEVGPPTVAAPAQWKPASEILPDAEVDFYPSQREAERALAAAIVEAYGSSGRLKPGFSQPQPLSLIHAMDGPPTDTYQTVADAVRGLGLAAHAVKPSVSNHTRQHGILLTLTPPTPESPIGVYHARDEHLTDPLPFAFTARFVDKPWLTDLSAYRIVQGSPKLVMGFSPNPESTAADAETAALRAVAAQLAPRIADHRGSLHADAIFDGSIMHPELNSIVRNLRRFDLVQDQFTQQLERSYGTVFRHAVLVDATPQTIQRVYNHNNLTWVDRSPQQQIMNNVRGSAANSNAEMAHGVAAQVVDEGNLGTPRGVFASYMFRVLGLGVLVGITLLMYRLLDDWTLGYRQGALSITVVAIILGGALLLGLLFVA